MKVLVTGAAGRLGTVVCRALLDQGNEVRATDQRVNRDARVPVLLADLLREDAVYPLLEGMEAVVHLGNIPNLLAGSSAQSVLTQNVTINANVMRAAVDVGVRRIVFASSIQCMVPLADGRAEPAPYTLPYFPLDGQAPANPGANFYGLSKEFGERTLQVLCQRAPELCATALRFPLLAGEWFVTRMQQPVAVAGLNLWEGLTYLEFSDAARVIGCALERQRPGYHQYFPAQALRLADHSLEATLTRFFSGTALRRPASQIHALVDNGALERELGFVPSPAWTVELIS